MKGHVRNFTFSGNNQSSRLLTEQKNIPYSHQRVSSQVSKYNHDKYFQKYSNNSTVNDFNDQITKQHYKLNKKQIGLRDLSLKISKIQKLVTNLVQDKPIVDKMNKLTKYDISYKKNFVHSPRIQSSKYNQIISKPFNIYQSKLQKLYKQKKQQYSQNSFQFQYPKFEVSVDKKIANNQKEQSQINFGFQKNKLKTQNILNDKTQINICKNRRLSTNAYYLQSQKYKYKQNKTNTISSFQTKQNIQIKNDYKLKNGKNLNQQLERIKKKMEQNQYNKNKLNCQDKKDISKVQRPNQNQSNQSISIINKQSRIKQFSKTQKNNQLNNINPNLQNKKNSQQEVNKQYKNQQNKILQALKEQFQLDQAFRKGKKWFNQVKIPMKWEYLRETLSRKGIKMSENQLQFVFKCQDQEKDPFYSSREEDQTIKSLVQKFLNAERHWIQKVHHRHSRLQSQGLTEQNIDLNKKGYLNIEDLIRFVNLRTGKMYSMRDGYLVYNRLKKGNHLTYKDIVFQLSESI